MNSATPMNTMRMARAERAELADLLDELSPEQWDAPTLCAGWRVRDVVAHVFSYEELGPRDLAARFAEGRFLLGRVNQVGVSENAERTRRELCELARRNLDPSGLTAAFGGNIALLDCTVHQQDIRRPLGIPRTIPADRVRAALNFARFAPPIRGAWRARGVRLAATDLDWTWGRGPEVRGAGEAVLMAMAGRPAALPDLEGPGVARLASHVRG